jgi:hypothetical protein
MKSKYEMCWEEIKSIGIGYYPIRGQGRQPWIYFSADSIFCPVLNPKMVHEKFFMVQYRTEIIDIIRVHWRGDIAGINSV